MTNINIEIPLKPNANAICSAVEQAGTDGTLHVTMKTTLKKYPGCTHWHFKRGKEPGILEVTWWPACAGARPARLWISVHNNRKADWMSEFIPRMKVLIEAKLST